MPAFVPSGHTCQCRLYNPVTATWSNTASLNIARLSHTATLLSNGKVLVAGGWKDSANHTTNSAELFDPNAQAPVPAPSINSASVEGKKLIVVGENFDSGAAILINGEEHATKNDAQNPQTTLIAKKAGRKIKPGDKIQVRNSTGELSPEFTFAGVE